jgi:hypothetical protein
MTEKVWDFHAVATGPLRAMIEVFGNTQNGASRG